MLLIANVLELNGGTTFILRLAREFKKRGRRIGVLVLVDKVDPSLESNIRQYADVYYLKDIVSNLYAPTMKSPLGVFVPVNFSALGQLIASYGEHVHAMGVFGLLFIKRCHEDLGIDFRISFGIYHQNEVVFEGVDYYFAKKAKLLFSTLPAASIVFFNEKTKFSHACFFKNDYAGSLMIPIGIDTPATGHGLLGDANSDRIVSIGNLYPFKSYNRHIINLLPGLKKYRPDLVYEIYGSGQYEPELLKLVASLQLEASVHFKGSIAYEDIPKVLEGALAFVGSGTAILEAAALGVPAVIGIESTDQPITYGLLSDIEGLSYNEFDPGQVTYPMKDVLIRVMESADAWEIAANACKSKSNYFTIEHTVDGFLKLENMDMDLRRFKAETYVNSIAACSFLACAFDQAFLGNKAFSMRREQGTLV